MSDTSVTTQAPTEGQPMRDATGTLTDARDVTQTTATQTTTPTTEPTTAPVDPVGTTETKDGTTVLTKPEAKTEETKPDAKAPDVYTAFTAPDGYTIDPKTIEAASPIFKELGLTQDQAQKLVDFHTGQMIEAAKGPQATYEALRTDWRSKVSADTEMQSYSKGGKSGLDAIKIDMGRALGSLGDAKLANEFKDVMDLTGAGDNPAFIKVFWKLSQLIGEGTHITGKGPSAHGQQAPSTKPPSPAQALYPNLS